MDGVLTDTAGVHARAWKEMFDGFLRARALQQNTDFVPFDAVLDYDEFVDGRERREGVRSFLASRGVDLPEGTRDDPSSADTIGGLANRKNELIVARIEQDGVEVFVGSVRFVRAVAEAGASCAVVSASANCREVLESAGIEGLFEVRVDGIVAEREGLHGKPAPDMYLHAARCLGVQPDRAAVFEDALAGVAAGRAGGFGLVVGVDRMGQADELRARGADMVVSDLAELLG